MGDSVVCIAQLITDDLGKSILFVATVLKEAHVLLCQSLVELDHAQALVDANV